MISNNTEYQEALTMVQTPLELTLSDLSARMNSEEYNYNNEVIYTALNDMYERIRLLEDMKDYIQTYVTKQIASKKKQFQDQLSAIEQNNDIYSGDDKKGIVVPIYWSEETIFDRDGASLSVGRVAQRTIYPNDSVIQKGDTTLVNHESERIPFDVKTSLTSYEAIYTKDKPDGSVYDRITFTFRQPQELNFVECDIYNATAAAYYTSENDELADVDMNAYVAPFVAKSISFDVFCHNYQIKSQSIDKDTLEKDAFASLEKIKTDRLDTLSKAADDLQNKRYDIQLKHYGMEDDA